MQFKLKDLPPETKPYSVLPWDHIKNMKSTPVIAKQGVQEAYRKIGWRMVATCLSDDGIGLALPQVGIFKRVILIREFAKNENGEFDILPSFKMYINPEWTGNIISGKNILKEWCLSVPGNGFPIKRFVEIQATWKEFEGDSFVLTEGTFEHFPARILQHENDHLNGVSIPQRWEIQNSQEHQAPPKNKKKRRKKK